MRITKVGFQGMRLRACGLSVLKPCLRVTRHAERLARGQLAELHFWKFRESVSIPVKQPKLFQVLL
jgi:hypothetical protein